MKQITVTLTARSPLAIGHKKPGGSVSEAMDYIPGSVIRGAIAGTMLRSGSQPEPGDDFHRLFLDDHAAVFTNGYPTVASLGEGEYELRAQVVQVLPATALSTKNNVGFMPDKAGAFDSLIDSFCAREQGYFYEPNDIKGNPVEAMGGFYSRDGDTYKEHKVTKRLLTRVGINRRRATAQDEILYSIEVMEEAYGKENADDKKERVPATYRSQISVSDHTLAEQLLSFLEYHCSSLRLGGSASRGLGKVEARYTLEDVAPDGAGMQKRITGFTTALAERWRQWNILGQQGDAPNRQFCALTLQSDAILTDSWQRTMVISTEMLAQALGIEASKLKLHAAHSSYGYRSGWNAAWGLPKDVELVTTLGSAFLFSMPADASCYEALAELELWGIGERTEEGYGQLRVCHEFHQVMRETPA